MENWEGGEAWVSIVRRKGELVRRRDCRVPQSYPDCLPPQLPPPAFDLLLLGAEGRGEPERDEGDEVAEDIFKIIPPPGTFSGDDSATPTPQPEVRSIGPGSGTATPCPSPSGGLLSPQSPGHPPQQQEEREAEPPREDEEERAELRPSSDVVR